MGPEKASHTEGRAVWAKEEAKKGRKSPALDWIDGSEITPVFRV